MIGGRRVDQSPYGKRYPPINTYPPFPHIKPPVHSLTQQNTATNTQHLALQNFLQNKIFFMTSDLLQITFVSTVTLIY